MPNWVYNTLTIQGPKEQVDYIKDKLNQPFEVMHDSWNMKTMQMEVSTSTYSNPVFAFWNIHSPLEDGITMEEYVQQPDHSKINTDDPDWFAKAREHAMTQKDWYNWNTSNWGTKWDVAVSDDNEYPDTELLEHISDGEDQWLVYKYNTAWSPAVSVLVKLSNLIPNCVLTLEFEEEQGWGGEYEIVKGEVTTKLEYENRCYACQSFDTLDYCEEGCGEFCSECNQGSWQDEAAMKQCQIHGVQLATTTTKGN